MSRANIIILTFKISFKTQQKIKMKCASLRDLKIHSNSQFTYRIYQAFRRTFFFSNLRSIHSYFVLQYTPVTYFMTYLLFEWQVSRHWSLFKGYVNCKASFTRLFSHIHWNLAPRINQRILVSAPYDGWRSLSFPSCLIFSGVHGGRTRGVSTEIMVRGWAF